MKFSASGRATMEEVMGRLFQEHRMSMSAKFCAVHTTGRCDRRTSPVPVKRAKRGACPGGWNPSAGRARVELKSTARQDVRQGKQCDQTVAKAVQRQGQLVRSAPTHGRRGQRA